MRKLKVIALGYCLVCPITADAQDARHSPVLLEKQSIAAEQYAIRAARQKVEELRAVRETKRATCIMTDSHSSVDRRCVISHLDESKAIASLAEAKADLALLLAQAERK